MCTVVNSEYFNIIHHEMGHVEYYMSYRLLPNYFKDGANPGFHEAVGDTIALSVMNKNHLKNLNFIESADMSDGEYLSKLN